MTPKALKAIEKHFGQLTDPRVDRTKEHKLVDIIAIALCAVICGAENWVDIELYGNSKLVWLRTFLELPHGIPSHDTFGRVFRRIDAQEFQKVFYEWVIAVNDLIQGQIVNIDGKCLRGSADKGLGKRAIYMVSAWASENEIVLGQRKVDQKSNEITAIPELLKMLSISGCIVTIDAMGTQTEIAQTIVDAQAGYALSVKENQGHLFEDIAYLFAVDQAQNFKYASLHYAKTTDSGHGRIDIRECWSTSNPEYLKIIRNAGNWAGLKSIAMIISTRIVGEEQTKSVRYYITTLSSDASVFCTLFAGIGPSRMNSIGFWMSQWMKTTIAFIRSRLLKTWLFCDTLLSIYSNKRKLQKVVFMPSNCKPLGIMTTSARY